MAPDHRQSALSRHWIELAWGAFALLNLLAMLVFGSWETVPFHFIWVSVTLLYGFRVWKVRSTAWTLAAVMLTTGAFILIDVNRGVQPIDEFTEENGQDLPASSIHTQGQDLGPNVFNS